jgi:hypothetical protein
MEVRGQPQVSHEDIRESYNPTPRHKINTLEGEARPKGKSLHKDEAAPPNANFKRRKASMPIEVVREIQGRSKLQELEEKSIADINK